MRKQKKSDKGWKAMISVKWNRSMPDDSIAKLRKNRGIKDAWWMGNRKNFMCFYEAKNPGDVERFVLNTLRKNKFVEGTETHWVKRYY
jgi:hypothetical protein